MADINWNLLSNLGLVPVSPSPMMTPMAPQAEQNNILASMIKPKEKKPTLIVSGPESTLPVNINEQLQQTQVLPEDTNPYELAQQKDASQIWKKILGEADMNLKKQAQYIDDIKAQPREFDFRPVASLVDNLTGSNYSKTAQAMAPMSEDEKNKLIFDLQDKLSKDRIGMLNSAMQNNKSSDSSKDARQEKSMGLKKEDTLRNDYTKNVYAPMSEDKNKFGMIRDGLASGDYQTVANTLSNFSRQVAGEKGVLTDQDISRVMPRNFQGDMSKVVSYFSSTPTTQIPVEYTKKLVELVNLAQKKAAARYKERAEFIKKSYSNPNSAYAGLWGQGGVGQGLHESTSKGISEFEKDLIAPAPKKFMSFEEWKASKK